jgi:hypothetical protein
MILVGALNASAQEQIESERADQGEDAHALQVKELQVEAGVIYNYFDTGANALIGESMIRYGLMKQVELRVMIEEGKERDRFIEETVQGFYPLAIGTKVVLIEKHKSLPDIALSGYVKLPFTSHAKQQTAYWSPALFAIFEKELENKKWDFLGNIGIKQESFATSYQWQAVGIVKYEGIKNLNIIAEYFANYQFKENPMHNLGLGVAYRLNNNFELDLSGGSTVFSDKPNKFIALGFAFRLPG